MVAVVTGSTAGLNTSSKAVIGTDGCIGNADSGGRGGEKIYVNAATGNLTIQRQDDFLVTLGEDLPLLNTYNSRGATAFDNNDGWQLSGSKRIQGLSGSVNGSDSWFERVDGDGSIQTFIWNSSLSRYLSTDGEGAHDSFERMGSGPYTWTFTDGSTGVTESYSDFGTNNGQIISRSTTDGRTVSYLYTGTLLTEIKATTSNGSGETDSILLYYHSNTSQISDLQYVRKSATDTVLAGGTRVHYSYNANGRLETITTDLSPEDNTISTGGRYETTFTYNGNGLVDKISQSDGSETSFTYELDGGVYWLKSVVERTAAAAIRTTTFSYDRTNQRTIISDPLGAQTVIGYGATGNLTSIQMPVPASPLFIFGYDGDGNVTSITDGLGQVTELRYDSRGNRVIERDAAGNTVTRTYDSNNLLLTETRYVVPDPDGAGIGALPSEALVTRHVYSATKHLRFVISPEGRVKEYRYDAAGNRSATIEYIGNNAYDVSSLSDVQTPSLSTMEGWVNTAVKSSSIRTDHEYDLRGALSKSTLWASVNASGDGVSGSQTITTYGFSYAGQLLSTADTRGNTTSYIYDGLGRQLTKVVTPASGLGTATTTTTIYDDANRKVETTFGNGLKTITVSDHAGQLLSLESIDTTAGSGFIAGTTQYYYDAAGRQIMVKDPLGNNSFSYYDASGRKNATVDAEGTYTKYQYNENNQLYRTTVYATRVDVLSLVFGNGHPTGIKPTPTTSANNDRYSYSIYDTANRLVYLAESRGTGGVERFALTRYEYDGASRLIRTIQRAAALNGYDPDAPISADSFAGIYDSAPSSDDRTTRYFYDNDSKLVGTLDANGYLTENKYNAGGQLAQTVRYYTRSAEAHWAAGSLNALRPGSVGEDITTSYIHDGKGRQTGVIDGEGFLTETQYDVDGNISAVIRYNDASTYIANADIAANRPSSSANGVHTTSYEYDAYNRITKETNFEGTITEYQYDNAGNLTSKTVAATQDARQTQKRYDVLGRVIAELTPQGATYLIGDLTQGEINAVWEQYAVKHFYDAAGNRVQTQDQNGYNTWFFYDKEGRLRYEFRESTTTGAQKADVISHVYNAFGQVSQTHRYARSLAANILSTATTDDLGLYLDYLNSDSDEITNYAYARNGLLSALTNAAGRNETFEYNAFGEKSVQLTQIDAARTRRDEFSYDRLGGLTESRSDTTGINAIEQRSYDAFGRLETIKDPRQVAAGSASLTTYRRDKIGRIVSTTDVLGRHSSIGYDAYDRVLTSTDVRGNPTSYAYNDTTRQMTVTTPEGVAVVTTYNRHGGQTLKVNNGGQAAVTTNYDANGRVTGTTDTLNGAGTVLSAVTYDDAGRMTTSTNANGVVTTYTYDAANRVLTRVEDAGNLNLTTTYTYDGMGRVQDVTEPNGTVTRTTYYRDSRVKDVIVDYGTTGQLNLKTSYTYDNVGNTVTVTEGQGTTNPNLRTTEYTFDNLGRRTKEVVDPGTGKLNLTTQYAYDKNNNLVRKTDANGNKTRYVYDAGNRLVYVVDALNGVTQTIHNTDVTIVKRYANNAAVATLSVNDELSTQDVFVTLNADAARDRVEQTVFDKDGREIYSINALGGVIGKTFNAAGQLDKVVAYKNALTAGTVYDLASDITAPAADPLDRETRYVYDRRGRLAFELKAIGTSGSVYVVTETAYDNAGNITFSRAYSATYTNSGTAPSWVDMQWWCAYLQDDPQNRTTLYWYDAANRQRFVQDANNCITEFSYSDATRTVTETRFATAGSSYWGNTTAQVDSATNSIANAQFDRVTKTIRDAGGRITQITDALNQSEYFGYDAAGNRISHTNKNGDTWTYAYDANGRLEEETAPAVSLTATSTTTSGITVGTSSTAVAIKTRMTYDLLGNVLTRTEGYGLTGTTVGWTGANATVSLARTTSYEYDALGRQTLTVYPSVQVYRWDSGISVASDREEDLRSLFSEVVYDGFGDAVISRKGYDIDGANVTSSRSYKLYDRLGRVEYEVDAEQCVTKYGYDTFGNQTSTIRYEKALLGTLPATPLTTLTVVASPGKDRTLFKAYDRSNRLVEVRQDAVSNYKPGTSHATGTVFTLAPKTTYQYNGFGEVIAESRVTGSGAGDIATRFYYYDRLGQRTDAIDELRYLTSVQYDSVGNKIRQVEYARQVTGSVTTNKTSWTAVLTPGNNTSDGSQGYDRDVSYEYDKLNRLRYEKRIGVEYTVSGATRSFDDLITEYGYDAIGNRTMVKKPSGAAVYSYYDKLGRVIGIADFSRNPGDGSTLTPYIEYQRNAFGDLVHEIRYSNSKTSGVNSATAPTAAVNDQHFKYGLDSFGRVIQSEEAVGSSASANGADWFASYNAAGQLAKEWQPVTNVDNIVETVVKAHRYDKLGRKTQTTHVQSVAVDPKTGALYVSASTVDNTAYNAFGEVRSNSENGIGESYVYDQAGRVWLSRASDGVTHVYLHDMDGRATAEIRSLTTDLTGATSASSVYSATYAKMVTETVYDALGHVVKQYQPAFTATNPIQALAATPVIKVTTGSNSVSRDAGYAVWYYAQHPDVPWITYPVYKWAPETTVAAGGGLYYPIDSPEGEFGAEPTCDETYTPVTGRFFAWSSPSTLQTRLDDLTADILFEYRISGTTTWASKHVSRLLPAINDVPTELGAYVGDLAAGTYEYQIRYRRPGEHADYLVQTGTMTNPATQNTISVTTNVPSTVTLKPVLQSTVDRWGNVLSATDSLGNTTNYRYNQNDQLTEKQLPLLDIRSTAGGTISAVSQSRPVESNYYDAEGLLVATKDGNGNVSGATYNTAGQRLTEYHPESNAQTGTKKFTFDAFGRISWIEDELGFKTKLRYDIAGNLIEQVREIESGVLASANPDENKLVRELYTYDSAGRRLTATTGEAGEITKYWYDLNGNVIKRTTPRGYATTMKYDTYNRLIEETDAIGGVKKWTYDNYGHVKTQTDLVQAQLDSATGGAVHTYSYGYAGQVTDLTSTHGQNIHYVYDAAGHVQQITDLGVAGTNTGLKSTNSVTTYNYDVAGRRIHEKVVETPTYASGAANITHQDSRITYDAAGRLAAIWDSSHGSVYEYDLVGNRTHTETLYRNMWTANFNTDDLWYQYDSANRPLVVGGYNNNGTISINDQQGTVLTYDKAGQRTTSQTYGTKFTFNGGASYTKSDNALTNETYRYDGLGRLTGVDKDAMTLQAGREYKHINYDKASRQTAVVTNAVEGTAKVNRKTDTVYDDDSRPITQTAFKNNVKETLVEYGDAVYSEGSYWGGWDTGPITWSYWSQGFDAAGNLRKFKTTAYQANGTTVRYTTLNENTYRGGETYQEVTRSATSSAVLQPGSTKSVYNVNGHLIEFEDVKAQSKNRYFGVDVNGNPLTVVKGSNGRSTGTSTNTGLATSMRVVSVGGNGGAYGDQGFFANGQNVGRLHGSDWSSAGPDFDLSFDPIVDDNPGSAPTQIVANAGDTLRIIAERLWGDGSLWFHLAEENGLDGPDVEIQAGTVVTVPNVVVNRSNNASTFKPYSISDALGDTTPTQQPIPPKKKGGCGALGMVIVVVVAIVVAAVSHGALSELSAAMIEGAVGATAAAGTVATTVANVATAVLSAAAGSIASQGVAIALGMQDGFSWKDVARAGMAAGVATGVATAFQQFDIGKSLFAKIEGVGNFGPKLAQGARAAVANVMTQGVSVAVGLQDSFNWRSVAVSAVAAPLADKAGKVGDSLGGSFARDVFAGTTSTLVRVAAGGNVDLMQAAADVFGNALGNAIVNQAAKPAASIAGGSKQSGAATSSDALEEIVVTAKRIGNNPTDSIPSGSNVSPDAAKHIDEIVVVEPPIYPGDDYGLDMWAAFETQRYWLNQDQRERVDRMGDAASANYAWRQQYGRNAPWATDRLARDYDALTHAASGTGGRLLAPGQAAGSSSVLSTVGKYALGGTETLLGGAYNYAVRVAGGVASVPYLLDSVDAAVAVQEGFSDRYSYDLRSQGALDIGTALQPVGQYVENNVLNPLRSYSEGHIGDAATTTLFSGAQAVVEIGGGSALNLLGKASRLGRVVDDVAANSPASRIDYSKGFERDLSNFKPGHQLINGPLDDDLVLVSYHADVPLGRNRSAKWWTTTDQANGMSTIDDVTQRLALTPDMGRREAVTVIRIPKGTDITAYKGLASPQLSKTGQYFEGDGVQYRFKNFDPSWVVDTRSLGK